MYDEQQTSGNPVKWWGVVAWGSYVVWVEQRTFRSDITVKDVIYENKSSGQMKYGIVTPREEIVKGFNDFIRRKYN